jgi:hypothetical protein
MLLTNKHNVIFPLENFPQQSVLFTLWFHKMVAVCLPETLVYNQKTTRGNNLGNEDLFVVLKSAIGKSLYEFCPQLVSVDLPVVCRLGLFRFWGSHGGESSGL